MKRVALIVITLLAALVAPACSLGERTEYTARLVSSPQRAEAAGTAVGTMTFALSVKPANDNGQGGAPAGGGVNLTAPPPGELPIVVDFKRKAASIAMAAPGGTPEPVVVLEGTKVYVRRGASGGISTRRWVVLDLAKVEEVSLPEPNDLEQRTGLMIVAFPGPLQLIELLAGSLTGSTERAAADKYAANLSREKADRELDLDDKAIEHRTTALTLVAVRDEVHPARITLDADGRPTAFEVRLKQQLRRDLKIETLVQTNLNYQPAEVVIPSPEDTLVLETDGQLIGELISLGRVLAGETEEQAP